MSESEENIQDNESEEISALLEERSKLLNEVRSLRDKLKEREQRHEIEEYVSLNDSQCGSVKSSTKNASRLLDISQGVLGVSFEDVDKNWLRDNIYEYKATVVTRAIRFFLELTVDRKSTEKFEIVDITCHFLENEIDRCYLNEIMPWIDTFTATKNFSLLISAVSRYSDQSIIRAKILSKLEKKNYVTLKNCMEAGGGITIFLHSPKNSNQIYLEIQWATRFMEKSWRIEYYFTIIPTTEGSQFIEENKELLSKFCRKGLGKIELEELWNELCDAVDKNDEV